MSNIEPTAARLFRLLDQERRETRFDREVVTPPDGKLHRDEFPSARFDAIDRLERADGAIDEAELAMALARLAEADRRLLEQELAATEAGLARAGKRFLWAFGGFAAGGVAIAAGALLGGTLGAVLLPVGALGVLGAFGFGVASILAGGRAGKRLFATLEGLLAR